MDIVVLLFMLLFAAAALFLLMREGLVKGPWPALACAVLLAAAFSLRASFFDRVTGDYQDFLARWVDYYRQNGGFRAFGTIPYGCNYHAPYLYFLAFFSYLSVSDLYLIKLLSVFFDLVLAWTSMKLVGRITQNALLRAGSFFALLFWPTVVLNGAYWGQCDSIYTAFALLGLWLALEDRPILSLVMWALSFSFKLQSVFVLPAIVVLWIYGKYRWYHLPVFPLAYLAVILPGVCMGLPLWDTILFYFKQTDTIGTGLNYNSSSIFALFDSIPKEQWENASRIGIVAAVFFLLNLLAVAWLKRRQLTDRSVLCLALLMSIGIPFFLPHMHDRYFYPADILSLALALSTPLFCLTAPLVVFASFLGYFAYMSFYIPGMQPHYLLPMKYGAIALMAAMVLTALALVLSFRKNRKSKPIKGSRVKKRA
ncbi:MAG: conjugal transfer protein TraL [Oscillospiraceae bacterium]|nr:conjugal transfer protein TraL [Oscillospiraceae bacterium]